MYKVSVHGIGKAGLPLCVVIAESGSQVIGVGRNEERTQNLNKAINPIKEEVGLSKLLKKRAGKNLQFTNDAVTATKKTKIHIIIVPLFIDKEHQSDLTNIKEASEKIGEGLKKGDLVVLETTVPVGTTNKLIRPILEKKSGLKAGKDFHLACSPERMMTGYAIARYQQYPKVVGGSTPAATKLAAKFYRTFCKDADEVSSIEAAELSKIFEGVYRDVNISLANELYKTSESFGLDFWEVRKAALHNNSQIHEPGNVGGHCIPVYPWFLINAVDTPLIKTARLNNDDMVNYYADKVKKTVKKGSKVLVYGIAFREGVKETAYTRSFALVEELRKRGYKVFAYDPMYSEDELKKFGLDYSDDFKNMEAIVIFNHYPELKKELKNYKNKLIDIKNSLR